MKQSNSFDSNTSRSKNFIYLTKTKIREKAMQEIRNHSPSIKISPSQNKRMSNITVSKLIDNLKMNKNIETKLPEIYESEAKITVNKTLDYFQNEINKPGTTIKKVKIFLI